MPAERARTGSEPRGPSVRRRWTSPTTLRTTGTARAFTDEPVSDATVHEILDDARFAPSGGNRQPWRVAVVEDQAIRAGIAEQMQPVWDAYVARMAARHRRRSTSSTTSSRRRSATPPTRSSTASRTVPVVLAVAADLRRIALMDGDVGAGADHRRGSIYPFCWSILLAARARGLGGVLTTFLSRAEPVAAPSLRPAARTTRSWRRSSSACPSTRSRSCARRPVESFATVDRFDGAVFTA